MQAESPKATERAASRRRAKPIRLAVEPASLSEESGSMPDSPGQTQTQRVP
jgi:hypothetical protein